MVRFDIIFHEKLTLLNTMSKTFTISKASKLGKKSLVKYFDSLTFLFESFKNKFNAINEQMEKLIILKKVFL